MAELIGTEPALSDLDAIADYIELDNPEAARGLVQRLGSEGVSACRAARQISRERVASPRAARLTVSADRRGALSSVLPLRRRTSPYSVRHAGRDAFARETSHEKRTPDSEGLTERL
jgi:plasmid stabilization system protein ParE